MPGRDFDSMDLIGDKTRDGSAFLKTDAFVSRPVRSWDGEGVADYPDVRSAIKVNVERFNNETIMAFRTADDVRVGDLVSVEV